MLSAALTIAMGLLIGCAGVEHAPESAEARRDSAALEVRKQATVAQTDPGPLHHDVPAGPEVDERVKNERAVEAMRHAIVLYEKFIQRAAGDPDMAEAVVRSRERIDELRQTIAVLESWR